MAKCINKECPVYSKCSRPLEDNKGHWYYEYKFKYYENEKAGNPCFKPIKVKAE